MGQRNAGGGAGRVALIGGALMSPAVVRTAGRGDSRTRRRRRAPRRPARPAARTGRARSRHAGLQRGGAAARDTRARPSSTCRAALGRPGRRRRQRQCRRDRRGTRAWPTRDPRVPVDVIGCSRPGKGAAVRRGLLTSRSRFVGFFDADLATPVETLGAPSMNLPAAPSAVDRVTLHARRAAGARRSRCAAGSAAPCSGGWPGRRRRGPRHPVRVQVLRRRAVTQALARVPDHRLRLRRRAARTRCSATAGRSSRFPSPGPTPPVRRSASSATAWRASAPSAELRRSCP